MPTTPMVTEVKPAFVVYINGWPGVGKLTVAKALQRQIANSQLLHNHELIDPVEVLYARSSSEYAGQRAKYRRARLAEVAELPQTVHIFTDAQTEYNTCVDDYVRLANPPHNRRFYSVVLHCDLEENVRRLTDTGRHQHSTGKLTDPDTLRGFRSTMEIFRFRNEDELEIDVTNRSAEDVATEVLDFIKAREEIGSCRAPR